MILVVGVTNTLGNRLVHGLREQGYDVGVLIGRNSTRDGLTSQELVSNIQLLNRAGVRPIWGDLKSEQALRPAMEGVDTVIVTTHVAKVWGPDSIEPADWQTTHNLIDAARAAGVRRFLLASFPGEALDHSQRLQQISERYERQLKRSGMTYTIVQPTHFMEVWIGLMVGIPLMTRQAVTLIGRGDHAHNFISEQDVADYFIAMLNHPQAFNQRVAVGGPASYTWTDIVSRVRNRMGADLPIQYAMLGAPISYLPEGAMPLASAFEESEHYLEMAETAKTFGVRPTTLDDYIDRTFLQG